MEAIMSGEIKNLQEAVDHSGGWDWENKHVAQSYVAPTDQEAKAFSINDVVESGTVLIAAGPADLGKATAASSEKGIRIAPIGLVETAQISMNKPLSRIFEIGSFLSYIIPGRAVGGISLSRVFFDGPSLLKVLYAGEVASDSADRDFKYATLQSRDNLVRRYAHIGSGNLAMNLASRFFNQPVGLAFYFQDSDQETVSQIYFEGCQVGTWNMGISANMNVLIEAVSIEFVRCFPIVTAATYDGADKLKNQLVDLNIASAPETDLSKS